MALLQRASIDSSLTRLTSFTATYAGAVTASVCHIGHPTVEFQLLEGGAEHQP